VEVIPDLSTTENWLTTKHTKKGRGMEIVNKEEELTDQIVFEII
jgi:hypothetical protein